MLDSFQDAAQVEATLVAIMGATGVMQAHLEVATITTITTLVRLFPRPSCLR